MMHYVHTGEAVVTSIKIDIFWLVTTRPIAYLERFACVRNCVGEFGTDTGQPLVTSNGMSNHLSYHHKAYYNNNNNNNFFFQCMGEYRRQHAKHLFSYLMAEGACQLDILDRPSCGRELTYESIPISIDGP